MEDVNIFSNIDDLDDSIDLTNVQCGGCDTLFDSPLRSALALDLTSPPEPYVPKKKQLRAYKKLEKIQKELQKHKEAKDVLNLPGPSAAVESRKRRAHNRKGTNAVETYDLTNIHDSDPIFANAASSKDVVVIDSDDEPAPKSDIFSPAEFDVENYEVSVKVNWRRNLQKHMVKKHAPFRSLMQHYATIEDVSVEFISLQYNDQFIAPDDTPHSINYKPVYFIDGTVSQNAYSTGSKTKQTKGIISVKVQSYKWKNPLLLNICETERLQILHIKVAEELKLDTSKIQLRWDGEPLDLKATAIELEMTAGEVFDVIILD